jgi:hypothetical protein
MKLPERIDIRVLADGRPAARMFASVTIRTTRKNEFGLGFGPTAEDGGLVISREDFLREAEKERRLLAPLAAWSALRTKGTVCLGRRGPDTPC